MYQVSFSTLVRHLQDILRLLKNIQIWDLKIALTVHHFQLDFN